MTCVICHWSNASERDERPRDWATTHGFAMGLVFKDLWPNVRTVCERHRLMITIALDVMERGLLFIEETETGPDEPR